MVHALSLPKSIVCFVLVFLAMDLLLFSIVFQAFSIFTPEERALAEQGPRSEGLVLGTSHGENGIDPKVLEEETGWSWYNYSRARRNLQFTANFSKELIRLGYRPKVVIIITSYHDWNERPHLYMIRSFAQDPLSLWKDFALQRELLKPRRWFLSDQHSSSYRMLLSRSLGFLKNRTTTMPYREDPQKGYRPQRVPFNPGPQPEEATTYPLNIRPVNQKALDDAIELWREVGAQVLLLDPPEFIGSRMSHRDYDRHLAMLEELARDPGVTAISHSDPSDPFLADPENFFDGGWGHPNSHLSHDGAQKYNRRLGPILKKIISPEPQP